MARQKAKPSASQLAHRGVDELFSEIVLNSDALFPNAHGIPEAFENLFVDVDDALLREWIAKSGPIPEDDDITREMLARECGYLIGVQIGLRLREVK